MCKRGDMQGKAEQGWAVPKYVSFTGSGTSEMKLGTRKHYKYAQLFDCCPGIMRVRR